MGHDELKRAAFILWTDYGLDGWRPEPFSAPALNDFLGERLSRGETPYPFLVTMGALSVVWNETPRNTLAMIHTHVEAARLNLASSGVPERELDRLADAGRLIRGLIARPGQRWELTPRGRRELAR